MKNFITVVLVSIIVTLATIVVYQHYVFSPVAILNAEQRLPTNYASFSENVTDHSSVNACCDFSDAATAATPAVVHIKTKTKAKQVTQNNNKQQRKMPQGQSPFGDFFGFGFGDDLFDHFFNNGPQIIPEQRASGSGVLITSDGYIVTNNHVVDGADEITVTLTNKKTYKAKVVGADAKTDLAVLKIEGDTFPYIIYGNSDNTKLGQWVLAIGYPLNLDVTVTAGIISAKSRSIGINPNEGAVESFLQTDAAVNPGNSGGALVNTHGELIGINTAIASPTGSYAGYSYAIPVNIVKKIVNDILKFGAVQRAYLGVQYPREDLSDDQKKQLNIKGDVDGVYVMEVPDGGAAKAAGIKKGDIIIKVDDTKVTSGADLQGAIAGYKPGDKITLTIIREGKQLSIPVTLKNKVGTVDVVKKSADLLERLGGTLATVDDKTAKQNNIDGGVVVKKIGTGLLQKTRMQEGFIITSINDVDVKNIDDLKKILQTISGNIRIQGIYPGYDGVYGYPLNLSDDE